MRRKTNRSLKVRCMFRSNPLPPWLTTLVVAVVMLLVIRLLGALQSDEGATVALRTYVFWALVCAPVAYLADVLGRTIMEYRIVRLAVARVRSRR